MIRIKDAGTAIESSATQQGTVSFDEIESITLETIPTMTVDFDIVRIGYENGKTLELTDEEEGFHEALAALTENLKIEIHFPIEEGTQLCVYERR